MPQNSSTDSKEITSFKSSFQLSPFEKESAPCLCIPLVGTTNLSSWRLCKPQCPLVHKRVLDVKVLGVMEDGNGFTAAGKVQRWCLCRSVAHDSIGRDWNSVQWHWLRCDFSHSGRVRECRGNSWVRVKKGSGFCAWQKRSRNRLVVCCRGYAVYEMESSRGNRKREEYGWKDQTVLFVCVGWLEVSFRAWLLVKCEQLPVQKLRRIKRRRTLV
jgi:hypothetical protein